MSPRRGEIRRPGTVHRLQPKVMAVLVYLAERPGELVSKDQLLEDLWPESFVTEFVLWRCIAQLRRLLEDDRQEPKFIETRPKLGYCLIAPVSGLGPLSASVSFGRRDLWLKVAAGALALVLLAFAARWVAGRSGPDTVGDSAAIESPSELLRQGLEHYRRYTWSDNAKAIQFLERAADLEPDNAAVLAALANAYAINWGRYASALNDRRWAFSALETAERAVSLDPLLPQAHKALGMAHGANGHPKRAAKAYSRAVELEPNYAVGLNNLAFSMRRLGHVDVAVELQAKALVQEPSNALFTSNLGALHLLLGDFDRARELLERALSYQEDHVGALGTMVELELTLGRTAEAAAAGRRAVEAHPRHTRLLQRAAAAEQLDGRPEVALELLRRATSDSMPGGIGGAILRFSQLLWQLDDREAASEIHQNFQLWIADALENEDNWRSAYWLAAIHAIRGEVSESAVWMERAVEGGFVDHWNLRWDPIFAQVVHDERYKRLLDELATRVEVMRRRVATTATDRVARAG